ncbi:3'(2'),5'-bisphosphate nucleotidase CysQ [Pseudidiomarina sp. 1ASP75-14]|uniref:3'(2'),5'-bisphosphate nucleotidase CysQ n=1 Tax=Pseudidiomarina terrestris TaxID=2820060 RepID=UPI00264B62D9|nr:3'(2'),5'-bisphosphate nucleotidase CysQ [Pseudidiomarina sp. 1ASP75-14]MDN7136756.1 3'(2'),5'-bisphosphate nucleotidase CysQ [Pseudidiomarina sp. 1ASP75-14]
MITASSLKELEAIARQAGDAIMAIYNADDFAERIAVQAKGDDSPLTQADLAAHDIIKAELTKLSDSELAALPQLSEESAAVPWQERQQWQSYWLIDPLDGTKEFIKRNGEFTVNIALIHKGQPFAGVVYAPATDTMYSAAEALGACKNGKPIRARQDADAETLKIVGSRSHASPGLQDYLDQLDKPYEMVPMGSSLKLCLVAESKAHLYPRLGPTSEWDTAAAHAVAVAAGASVTTTDGEPLRYNQKASLLNPYFIVK